jgi:hypothetical protein
LSSLLVQVINTGSIFFPAIVTCLASKCLDLLTFTFTASCVCAVWGRHVAPHTLLYVNWARNEDVASIRMFHVKYS